MDLFIRVLLLCTSSVLFGQNPPSDTETKNTSLIAPVTPKDGDVFCSGNDIGTQSSNKSPDMYIIGFTKKEEVPDVIAKKFSVPDELSEAHPWYLLVAEDNDNMLLGLWSNISPNTDGNDTGYTHGMNLQAGKLLAKGITVNLDIKSQLFTKDDNSNVSLGIMDKSDGKFYKEIDTPIKKGNTTYPAYWQSDDGSILYNDPITVYHDPNFVHTNRCTINGKIIYNCLDSLILFTEKNSFKLSFDNINKNKVTYWRLGTEVDQLQGNKMTIGASGEQKVWHHEWNQAGVGMPTYDYEPDASNNRLLALLDLAIGLNKTIASGAKCSLTCAAEAEQKVSNNGIFNSTNVSTDTKFAFKSSPKSTVVVNTGLSDANNLKDSGNKLDLNIGVKLIRPKTIYSISWGKPCIQYTDKYQLETGMYDDHDPIMTIGIKFLFPGSKKSK